MRVIFAGTPTVALPSLAALQKSAACEVVGVLTRPDAPIGRKRVLTPSPVAAEAESLGLPVIRAAAVDAQTQRRIAELSADIAAVVAYGALVPPAALKALPHGWVNLHFSLLPAWRGAAPVQHALIHGDDITGASTFLLEEGLDTGPVYGTMTEQIRREDTATDLLSRLSISGAALLTKTLTAISEGTAQPIPQQGEISLAPKLHAADGRIDFNQPALAVWRRIRGVTHEPGAWAMLADQRIKLGPVQMRPDQRQLPPGQLDVQAGKLLAGTGSYAVELGQVQPAGKKMMDAMAWIRGLGTAEVIRGMKFDV
ncbi:methionyl-tRNA formyltransferase [Acaricomes phytoseiuli]|uniref:methionyl-tRNA formyltransferase n=1 Tax=Acaricomes phytoseiuli TaxID=291968 RepID=UPI000478053C|nr:methionyl-tRNA formyltransferase [Acaricomes phytoseiuli]MCW1249064.1 methionyl-tRNA formyltransferase [Acaricomes phytoseiuli]